eukprot:TRINITY_DN4150_c0_g1_i7.p1 TRINITY_DN4150_c0_g1~~TRINITY_DN4150_c0_g1_i7.p1  ORF type:complete len:180 (+),score=40.44 TRINITY_DN4150_c0_g1_i7:124-663(+)
MQSETEGKSEFEFHHAPRERRGPRIFTWEQKEECWNRAAIIMGRHPDRWRLDAMGNPVCKALRGCEGPLCHEYDHIIPFSKGGRTVVENCQVLQTGLNKRKSNLMEVSFADWKKEANLSVFTDAELDSVERAAFGNVIHPTLEEMMRMKVQRIEAIRDPNFARRPWREDHQRSNENSPQ